MIEKYLGKRKMSVLHNVFSSYKGKQQAVMKVENFDQIRAMQNMISSQECKMLFSDHSIPNDKNIKMHQTQLKSIIKEHTSLSGKMCSFQQFLSIFSIVANLVYNQIGNRGTSVDVDSEISDSCTSKLQLQTLYSFMKNYHKSTNMKPTKLWDCPKHHNKLSNKQRHTANTFTSVSQEEREIFSAPNTSKLSPKRRNRQQTVYNSRTAKSHTVTKTALQIKQEQCDFEQKQSQEKELKRQQRGKFLKQQLRKQKIEKENEKIQHDELQRKLLLQKQKQQLEHQKKEQEYYQKQKEIVAQYRKEKAMIAQQEAEKKNLSQHTVSKQKLLQLRKRREQELQAIAAKQKEKQAQKMKSKSKSRSNRKSKHRNKSKHITEKRQTTQLQNGSETNDKNETVDDNKSNNSDMQQKNITEQSPPSTQQLQPEDENETIQDDKLSDNDMEQIDNTSDKAQSDHVSDQSQNLIDSNIDDASDNEKTADFQAN